MEVADNSIVTHREIVMIKPMASVRAEQRITSKGRFWVGHSGLFWIMMGLELCLLLSVLVWLLSSIPLRTPLATTPDVTELAREIQGRINGTILDPMIEIKPGITVHSSNIRGFRFQGHIYYYYVEGAVNYDPLSRGLLRLDQVEIVLRDESGVRPIVIYRVQ
jgi:hypothetical protein